MPEEVGSLLREGEDREASERMADEDDRSVIRIGVDDSAEIARQPLDRGRLRSAPATAAMSTLIEEDQPSPRAQRRALLVEYLELRGEAMREENRDVGVCESARLRVQEDPVLGPETRWGGPRRAHRLPYPQPAHEPNSAGRSRDPHDAAGGHAAIPAWAGRRLRASPDGAGRGRHARPTNHIGS